MKTIIFRKQATHISVVLLLITWAMLLFSSFWGVQSVFAQGWQMYADQIKQQAAEKRMRGNGSEETFSSDFSVPAAQQSLPEVPPVRTFSANQTEESEINVMGGSAAGEPQKRSGKARQGLLDFSEMLGEKPQEWNISELTLHREETELATKRAASLPSCRNLPEMQNDARLNDLFFLDSQRGFVVGDRGTIWGTNNGGIQWSLLSAPTDANLYSIHFGDQLRGIIVGGRILPGQANGEGVILVTDDGGQNWITVSHPSYPILRQIRFCDPQQVWMTGDSSELYPGGIFTSEDGGQNWGAIVGNRHQGWSRLLYHPIARTGIGVSLEGSLQHARGPLRAVIELPIGNRRLADLCQLQPNDPLRLVGEKGLMMESRDGGISWSALALNLPENGAELFDLRAVWGVGDKIIAAGSPGSLIFSSTDSGQNWTAVATGVSAGIIALTFSDPMNGWAVGELGTILATNNGGQTWSLQRCGGSRYALLGLMGQGEEIPLELFAEYCGEEGYLGRVHLLAREENQEKTTNEIPWPRKLEEAIITCGAQGLLQSGSFHLDARELDCTAEEIIARFDRENDSKGLDRFREHLVFLIRQYCPDLLVIADPKFSPFAALIDRELPRALQAAADPMAYPEQLTITHLVPWKISKVYRYLKEEAPPKGHSLSTSNVPADCFRLNTSRFCPSLGRTLWENTRECRSFLGVNMSDVPPTTSLQLLFEKEKWTTSPGMDIFVGLQIPYGSTARRERQRGLIERQTELVKRSTRARELVEIGRAFVTRDEKNGGQGEALLSQLSKMIEGIDSEMAIEYLLEIGRTFAQQGKMSAAEEVFAKVALEFSRHPLSREALIWLIKYYSGREPHWRSRQKNRYTSTEATLTGSGITGQTKSRLALDASTLGSRHQNANDLGKLIREVYPELYMDPEIRFPLAMIQRQLGYNKNAQGYYLQRSMLSKNDLWGVRAQAEYWLMTPNKESLPQGERICPLATMASRAISGKPFLDGILEPEVWGEFLPIDFSVELVREEPKSPDKIFEQTAISWQKENRKKSTPFGTRMALLYDNDFLYIGIVGKKVPGFDYAADDDTPRTRDADLVSYDRVELSFDLDRDYVTAYRFVFDYRGWANEIAWNDTNWNPVLFIANHQTDDYWTLEIAIPMEELVDKPPTRADVWNVSARRIVPGNGVECWNSENSIHADNGFGFLTFGF